MGAELARPDRVVAKLASQQHGIVTFRMLIDAGLSRREIDGRTHRGLFHPIHRGVYAVGHSAISQRGRFLAAVLACQSENREAFLSHRSAAALWNLLPAQRGPIDMVIHRYSGRGRRAGIRIHRSETLEKHHVTTSAAIPVTTPARTIWDLSRGLRRRRPSGSELRRAIRQAGLRGFVLDPEMDWDGTRSDLESAFLALCKAHRLPDPEVNAIVAGLEVDFHWASKRLVVETDGYAFHKGRGAFIDDRRRELELRLHGFDLLRFSHDQVLNEEEKVATLLRHRLADLAS